MQSLHIHNENPNHFCQFQEKPEATVSAAMEKLENYLQSIPMERDTKSFSEHETIITKLVQTIGQKAIGQALLTYDVQSDLIGVENQMYRKKHYSSRRYQTAFGTTEIKRHVYVNRKKDGDGKSICPLELCSGIIENYWTPNAAKNAAWALAHLTPQESESLFFQLGGMDPSKSSLDRLPKFLDAHWEPNTITYHKELIENEQIPEDAVTMAASLDGVMVALKSKKDTEKTDIKGHCEWREASCGTVSFYNKEGERLCTYQYGRMPETKKETLKSLLKAHIESSKAKRQKLNIVYIADGARDNWSFIEEELPMGFGVADFYHACEYLKTGFEASYDLEEDAIKNFEKYKIILRDDEDGIKKVLRKFRALRDKDRNNKAIKNTLTYLTNNQHRMKYAQAQKLNYPIGSGIVEAACKTLVGQRLKRSGMSWHIQGGQAILTLRSLIKSNRFEESWQKISSVYKKPVTVYKNVIKFPEQKKN